MDLGCLNHIITSFHIIITLWIVAQCHVDVLPSIMTCAWAMGAEAGRVHHVPSVCSYVYLCGLKKLSFCLLVMLLIVYLSSGTNSSPRWPLLLLLFYQQLSFDFRELYSKWLEKWSWIYFGLVVQLFAYLHLGHSYSLETFYYDFTALFKMHSWTLINLSCLAVLLSFFCFLQRKR